MIRTGTRAGKAVILPALLALSICACGKKDVRNGPSAADTVTDITPEAELEVSVGGVVGEDFGPHEALRPVRFDFDRHVLSAEARKTLQDNAKVLNAHDDWTVAVEGYCDDRGTVAYNLALGQKRAQGVLEYYSYLGVPASSMRAVSYGEEKPVCGAPTEECWARNRKAETKVRLK